MQMRRHESEVNKMKEQAIRHKQNTILEKEKFKQKAHDNQEKIRNNSRSTSLILRHR